MSIFLIFVKQSSPFNTCVLIHSCINTNIYIYIYACTQTHMETMISQISGMFRNKRMRGRTRTRRAPEARSELALLAGGDFTFSAILGKKKIICGQDWRDPPAVLHRPGGWEGSR